MMNMYEVKRKLNYFLAKRFGIAHYDGVYVLPCRIYVFEREHDDDRWYEYENVGGTQLYPIDKNWLKYKEVFFGECSLYRQYVRNKLNERKRG